MKPATCVLLTIILFSSCHTPEAPTLKNCSVFWEGEFYNMHNGLADTRIKRKGNFQIEQFKDGSVGRYTVEWLDSCKYRLTPVGGNQGPGKEDSLSVIVQITEIKENSYTIKGWVEGDIFRVYESEIFRGRP